MLEHRSLIILYSCLYCEDVIKSKLSYGALMRPTVRPKHVSAPTYRYVKTLFHNQLNIQFCCEMSTHSYDE